MKRLMKFTLLILTLLVLFVGSVSADDTYTAILSSGEGNGADITYTCTGSACSEKAWNTVSNLEFFSKNNNTIAFYIDEYYLPPSFSAPTGKYFNGWKIGEDDYTGFGVEFNNGKTTVTVTASWMDPDSPEINTLISGIPAAEGGYVYMGVSQNYYGEQPIRWHVIGMDNDKWLLFAAEQLDYKSASYINGFPNVSSYLSDFSSMEQNAMAVTSFEAQNSTINRYEYYSNASIAKLFLLSAQEAVTYMRSKISRLPGDWWLRSGVQGGW